MLSQRTSLTNHSLSVLITLLGCAMLSACAPNASSNRRQMAMNSSLSAQDPAQLIAQLRQAKALDGTELKDPTLSINRRGDLLDHEVAAEQAIRDLQDGIPVAQDRFAYALEVPPSHLTSAQKTALIQQLRDAIREDDRREQAVVAFSSNVFYEDPDAPSEFGYQEQLAQKELAQLERGDHVSWDAVQQALYVPPEKL